MRKAAPDVLVTARAQRWEPAEVLRLLISEEVTGRDAATRRLRRHSANFPTGKTLASWRAEDSTIPDLPPALPEHLGVDRRFVLATEHRPPRY
ncbi:hypothetical protein [Streptomyces sp. NPDC046985]|uniref:hypothetical protein n=1 Tax=Streptomyces sp. NPDC046985 TaxID=3155377 RepID=UPI0033E0EE6A